MHASVTGILGSLKEPRKVGEFEWANQTKTWVRHYHRRDYLQYQLNNAPDQKSKLIAAHVTFLRAPQEIATAF